ncbi:hypothetical protein HKX48_001288 [Thoreauomyces humboldtii]|nr:hypothetical protein HKX48_001288 [Thoreauomyces humboldtii]
MRLSFIAPVVLALSTLTSASVTQVQARSSKLNTIVAFGDSLTDNGNAFVLTGGQTPSPKIYWKGRFSNGPVWIEYLASSLGATLVDKAFSGATSNNLISASEMPQGTVSAGTPGFVQQAALFAAHPVANANAANTLLSVWIGANDYFYGTEHGRKVSVNDVTGSIITGLQTLVDAGYKNFMVVNMPPTTTLPFLEHNALLAAKLVVFSTKNIFQGISVHAVDAPITYATVYAKLLVNGTFPSHTSPTDGCANFYNVSQVPCTDPQDYVSWDGIHPTTTVHQLMAGVVQSGIQSLFS